MTQLAEQAKIMKQTSDQCSNLKSRLDYFEKKQAGIDHRALGPTTLVPPVNTHMTFAQAAAQNVGALASNSVPPVRNPLQPPMPVRVPPQAHGLYYGDVAIEALPPVHDVRPALPNCPNLPAMPPYPDEPFSVYSIERAQCAVLLGPFNSADLDQLGQDLGDMSQAYIQAIRSFLSEKMLMPQDTINNAGIREACLSADKKLCVKFAT